MNAGTYAVIPVSSLMAPVPVKQQVHPRDELVPGQMELVHWWALSVLYKHPRCPRFPRENQAMEGMKYQGESYPPVTSHPCRILQRPLNQVYIPHRPGSKKIQSSD